MCEGVKFKITKGEGMTTQAIILFNNYDKVMTS